MINTATSPPSYSEVPPRQSAVASLEAATKFALYIGKSASVIHELMLEIDYAGVAADNLFSAQQTLQKLHQNHDLLPDVIICEYRMKTAEIKTFLSFVQHHDIYKNIPFLLLLDEKDNYKYSQQQVQNLPGVDDVIFYNSKLQDINHKIEFLRKFKNLKSLRPVKKISREIKVAPHPNFFFKRLFDIFFASLTVILLSPLLILITLLIKITSKGPVLYTSLRAGKGYKVFKFYKFRTMVENADKKLQNISHLNQYNNANNDGGAPLFIKVKNDPRITKFGAFLRNTSLDELPQLINVVKGDMSLVGNRPLPLYEAITLTQDSWAERFLAPAGITGLWQVSKRGRKNMSAEERVNLDITYANKSSFTYDMWIMLNTPFALIQKESV